jgi:hypothetical protein
VGDLTQSAQKKNLDIFNRRGAEKTFKISFAEKNAKSAKKSVIFGF